MSKNKHPHSNKALSKLLEETESAKSSAHISDIFLKNITKVLPQYVFWKDIHSVYLGCNENYANLLGLTSPEEIVGKTDVDLNWQSVGHTADTFQAGDKDTISGHPITNREEILALPTGKVIITLVSKLPIIHNGEVLGVVGYFTDITELKNKEKELEKAKKEAEIANSAKTQFIQNMEHDIRTPLVGACGFVELLASIEKNEKMRNNLFDIYNCLLKLLDYLDKILEFIRIDQGMQPISGKPVNLLELLRNVSFIQQMAIKHRSINFKLNFDNAIPELVKTDDYRLTSILINLVSNAIKFTEKGSVTLSAKLVKKLKTKIIVSLSIEDTGIGIPKDKQNVIFDKFVRLSPSNKGLYPGQGLGLGIVKKFVDELNGKIKLSSEVGKGSCFEIILPFKRSDNS